MQKWGGLVRNGDRSATCPVVTGALRSWWLAESQACAGGWGGGGKGRLQSDREELKAQSCGEKGKAHVGVGMEGLVSGDSPGHSKHVSCH